MLSCHDCCWLLDRDCGSHLGLPCWLILCCSCHVLCRLRLLQRGVLRISLRELKDVVNQALPNNLGWHHLLITMLLWQFIGTKNDSMCTVVIVSELVHELSVASFFTTITCSGSRHNTGALLRQLLCYQVLVELLLRVFCQLALIGILWKKVCTDNIRALNHYTCLLLRLLLLQECVSFRCTATFVLCELVLERGGLLQTML